MKNILTTYWCESAALVWMVSILAVFLFTGMNTNFVVMIREHGRLVYSFAPYLLIADLAVLLFTGGIHFLRKRPPHWSARLGKFFKRQAVLWVGMGAVVLVSVHFTQLKTIIPYLNPSMIDPHLVFLDQLLFFGNEPAEILAARHMSRAAVLRWDYIYMHSFHALYLGVLVMLIRRPWVDLLNLFRGVVLIYMLGLVFSLVMPSAGPCFFDAERFAAPSFTISYKAQHYLFSALQALLTSPKEFVPQPFLGISAFPSLHVAQAFLPILFFLKKDRWVQVMLIPFCILISISTIVLGWHYAIDAPAGVLLAICVFLMLPRRSPNPVPNDASEVR